MTTAIWIIASILGCFVLVASVFLLVMVRVVNGMADDERQE
jgi:hypothetical protein